MGNRPQTPCPAEDPSTSLRYGRDVGGEFDVRESGVIVMEGSSRPSVEELIVKAESMKLDVDGVR